MARPENIRPVYKGLRWWALAGMSTTAFFAGAIMSGGEAGSFGGIIGMIGFALALMFAMVAVGSSIRWYGKALVWFVRETKRLLRVRRYARWRRLVIQHRAQVA